MGQRKNETREEYLERTHLYNVAKYAACKEQANETCKAYHTAHRSERNARARAYYATNKSDIAARHREYMKTHMEGKRARAKQPLNKAKQFLRRHPDCTSLPEEIASIYGAHVDWLGRPIENGSRYHLEHVHGGRAIGLVPLWLNIIFSETAVANWDEVKQYAKLSRGLE